MKSLPAGMYAVAAILLATQLPAASARADPAELMRLRAAVEQLSARVRELEKAERPGPARADVARSEALATIDAARAERLPAVIPPATAMPTALREPAAATAVLDRAGTGSARQAAFQLSGGGAGGRVSVQVQNERAWVSEEERDRRMGQRFAWGLTASAPAGKGTSTDIASIDGIGDAASLTLDLTWFRVPLVARDANPGLQAFDDLARDRCLVALREEAVAASADAVEAIGTTLASSINACSQGSPSVRKTHLQPEELELRRRLAFDARDGIPVSFGVSGSLVRHAHDYREIQLDADGAPVGLASADSSFRRVGFELAGRFGLYPTPASAVLGSVEYGSGFEKPATLTICPPHEPTRPVSCRTGRFAPGVHDETLGLGVEYRQFLTARLAIAPKFTADLLSSAWAIDTPISFVPDDKGNLIGGIRVGYQSRRNAEGRTEGDLKGSIFVGSRFTIE